MKSIKRITAMLLVAVLVFSSAYFLPDEFTAKADEGFGFVNVEISNSTYHTTEGAAWEGDYVASVALGEDDTAFTLLEKACEELELEIGASESSWGHYLYAIGGLSAGDAGSVSGWYFKVNNWIPNVGIDGVSVASGDIKDGCNLLFCYTADGGADIGNDMGDASDASLVTLSSGKGSFDKEFSADEYEYTLSVPEGSESVIIDAVPKFASFQVRMYKDSFAPESDGYNAADDDHYTTIDPIPVEDGTVIYVGVAYNTGDENDYDKNWPGSLTYIYEMEPPYNYEVVIPQYKVYKITIEMVEKPALEDIYKETGDFFSEVTDPVYGNAWMVLCLARDGRADETMAEAYYNEIKAALEEAGGNKLDEGYSTVNSREAIVLTALGYDATDVDGANLLEPLSDLDYIQYLNGYVYALLAFDSADYEASEGLRNQLIEKILEGKLEDGGYAWFGDEGDVDLTAMVLTALAPYADSNEDVKAAIEEGLALLSSKQKDDGSFPGYDGVSNTESAAQVLIALSSLGIDGSKDERFVKEGGNVLDAVTAYYLGDGQFSHIADPVSDFYATYQAYQALISYYRMVNGERAFYDIRGGEEEEPSGDGQKDEPSADGQKDEPAKNEEKKVEEKKNETSPKTGDSTSVIAVSVLALVSLAGICALKKKESR